MSCFFGHETYNLLAKETNGVKVTCVIAGCWVGAYKNALIGVYE